MDELGWEENELSANLESVIIFYETVVVTLSFTGPWPQLKRKC